MPGSSVSVQKGFSEVPIQGQPFRFRDVCERDLPAKTDKHFSPSTRYADYPISPVLFHWETQNTTSPNTPAGRRYIQQGSKVILFVRERKQSVGGKTMPYHCLGPVHYQGHESERPMKIPWKLDRPMPGWLYQAGKVVADKTGFRLLPVALRG